MPRASRRSTAPSGAVEVTLEVISRYAVDLELEAAREHGQLFEKVFDCTLRLRQGLEVAAGMTCFPFFKAL